MSELVSTFGINWKLLGIQALNFGVLLVLLHYFLYRPILAMIDERRHKIEQGVVDAEAAAVKLASAETERETMLHTANVSAEKIVTEAEVFAKTKGALLLKEAETKRDALLADAKARAEEAKRQALKESEAEVARLAILSAEKILRQKLN